MDFGELEKDTEFVDIINKAAASFESIEELINKICAYPNYDELSIEEKVKCDLFMLYSINSLFFIYLKLQGKDVSKHGIMNELSRVRQAMVREKDLHERNTIRPTLDKDAAQRFVRHELGIPREKLVEAQKAKENSRKLPKNRKRKFEDDDD